MRPGPVNITTPFGAPFNTRRFTYSIPAPPYYHWRVVATKGIAQRDTARGVYLPIELWSTVILNPAAENSEIGARSILPTYLVPEQIARTAGFGPVVDLGSGDQQMAASYLMRGDLSSYFRLSHTAVCIRSC